MLAAADRLNKLNDHFTKIHKCNQANKPEIEYKDIIGKDNPPKHHIQDISTDMHIQKMQT